MTVIQFSRVSGAFFSRVFLGHMKSRNFFFLWALNLFDFVTSLTRRPKSFWTLKSLQTLVQILKSLQTQVFKRQREPSVANSNAKESSNASLQTQKCICTWKNLKKIEKLEKHEKNVYRLHLLSELKQVADCHLNRNKHESNLLPWVSKRICEIILRFFFFTQEANFSLFLLMNFSKWFDFHFEQNDLRFGFISFVR